MKLNKYKFRAECKTDVDKFLKRIKYAKLKLVQPYHTPDCVVEFYSKSTLQELRLVLEAIVDGHVMLETIALSHDYTGKRIHQ